MVFVQRSRWIRRPFRSPTRAHIRLSSQNKLIYLREGYITHVYREYM